jgi:hypothetical protein
MRQCREDCSSAQRFGRRTLADARSLAALRDWLGAINLRAIEIFDPLSLPIRLLMLLFGLGRPVDLAGGDCEWVLPARLPKNGAKCHPVIAGPCEACASPFARDGLEAARALRLKRRRALLSKVRSIRPLDRMSEVFARHVFGDTLVAKDDAHVLAKTPFAPRDSTNGALAILSPSPCVQADRMIVALGRALLRRGQAAGIVVLGECVDDLAVMGAGNVFVAGRVETEEYERLFAQYEISALMSPHRTHFFGHLDRASIDSGLPKAYFDWTCGKLETSPGDLALDQRLCDARAAAALADWLGSVRAGTGEQ